MAGKFETVCEYARTLISEGVISVLFGQKTFRGNVVECPEQVFVKEMGRLISIHEQLKIKITEAQKNAEGGVFGAKNEVYYAEWREEFVHDILRDKNGIRTYSEQSEFEGYGVEPVTIDVPTTLEPVDVKTESVEVKAEPVSNALGVLEQAVAQVIAQTQGKAIAEQVTATAIEEVRKFIQNEYGTITKKVNIETHQGKVISVQGQVHERFDEVLAFVQADEPCYLVGPAGCGKNVLCKQVAEALGLDFYFSNAVTQEYKITGFTDAMGVFQEPQFYKAFKDGGLFFLDELDASIPEVLLILNSAITNRYFDFPAPIGRVEAHPDFRVIAAGNTIGMGASLEYVGRAQLDAATLDRFAVIDMDYDRKIELGCANNDEDLVDFIHDVRQSAEKGGIQIVVSYRGLTRLAKMVPSLGMKRALETCLFKGMEEADKTMLLSGIENKGNRYYKAYMA